jgi:hypothetical protein
MQIIVVTASNCSVSIGGPSELIITKNGIKTTKVGGPQMLHICGLNKYALIKKTIKFSSYKEIQNGAVAKSYMTNGLLIYGEIFAHFLIY